MKTKKTVRRVRWKDASFQDGCKADGSDVTDYICETVGFLVREDDDLIVLAMEQRECEDATQPFKHVVQIPKVSII